MTGAPVKAAALFAGAESKKSGERPLGESLYNFVGRDTFGEKQIKTHFNEVNPSGGFQQVGEACTGGDGTNGEGVTFPRNHFFGGSPDFSGNIRSGGGHWHRNFIYLGISSLESGANGVQDVDWEKVTTHINKVTLCRKLSNDKLECLRIVLKILEKKTEAVREGRSLQDSLADIGVAQEAASDEVNEGVLIFEVTDKFLNFVEGRAEGVFNLLNFFQNFCNKGIAGDEAGGSGGLGVI